MPEKLGASQRFCAPEHARSASGNNNNNNNNNNNFFILGKQIYSKIIAKNNQIITEYQTIKQIKKQKHKQTEQKC